MQSKKNRFSIVKKYLWKKKQENDELNVKDDRKNGTKGVKIDIKKKINDKKEEVKIDNTGLQLLKII